MYSGCVHHINLTVIAYNYTSVVGGDRSCSGTCLAIQVLILVEEAVLDRLLASFLLGFIYECMILNFFVVMARLSVVALSSMAKD